MKKAHEKGKIQVFVISFLQIRIICFSRKSDIFKIKGLGQDELYEIVCTMTRRSSERAVQSSQHE